MEYKDEENPNILNSADRIEVSAEMVDPDDEQEVVAIENPTEQEIQNLILATFNELTKISQNMEDERRSFILYQNLRQIIMQIKKKNINLENLQAIPEFLPLLIDVSAECTSIPNSKICLNTLWCLISRIPKSIEALLEFHIAPACLSKINETVNITVIPAIYILYYLVDHRFDLLSEFYEYMNPNLFLDILQSMESQAFNFPEESEEFQRIKRDHRLIIESVALFMTHLSKVVEGEDTGVLIRLIFYILDRYENLPFSYCLLCLRKLFERGQIALEDVDDMNLMRFIEKAYMTKYEPNCQKASFLVISLIEKNYPCSILNITPLMNYLRTTEDKGNEMIARKALALICERASPIIRQSIAMHSDFPTIVIEAIARKDEVGESPYIGDYSVMKLAGRAYLGVLESGVTEVIEDNMNDRAVLALLVLLTLDNEKIVLRAIHVLDSLYEFSVRSGAKDDFLNSFTAEEGLNYIQECEDNFDESDEVLDSIAAFCTKMGFTKQEQE